jgi:HEAT repeat protein
MQIPDIQTHLASSDPQIRMRGLTALRSYEPEVAVPLLALQTNDNEAIIRSLVAMGLGYKQNEAAFQALLAMLENDADPNVRAEAASALSKYGKASIPHIVSAFYKHPHWLMRMSVLMAFVELKSPQVLFQLCLSAFVDTDPIVKETAVQCLALLADSSFAEDALLHLIAFAQSEQWQIRKAVAIALRAFSDSRAQEALVQLRKDTDYRVIAAILEQSL